MDLTYSGCLELTYPEPISDEGVRRLVRAILDNEPEMYAACEALVSHGTRVSREVCNLLKAWDANVVATILHALSSNPLSWDESVITQVEECLKSNVEDVKISALLFYAMITPDRGRYASYLCDLAFQKKKLRFVCMSALSYVEPIPASCRSKLEGLLAHYPRDSDFHETVKNRLSEIEQRTD